MEPAFRITLALTILTVAATVHLVGRHRTDDRSLLMRLGRPRTAADGARERRVQLVNAVTTAVALALALGSDRAWVPAVVGGVLPLVPITWMLVEMVGLLRSLPAPSAPGRFAVSLDRPPPAWSYVSPPLVNANIAVVVISAGVFLALRPLLPEQMALQFDGSGNPSRWGNPGELWMLLGIQLFDLALLAGIVYAVARERWALPVDHRERYIAAQMQRRSLLVRLCETLMLGINLPVGLMWIGLAVSALPGKQWLVGWVVGVGVALSGVGVVLPIALFIRPMLRAQSAVAELGGSDALGTRASGWRLGGAIYFAPEDPAVFVPKLRGIGQTLNFARPGAWAFLTAVVLAPIVLGFASIALAR